jgi:hypothetical protein
MKTVLLLVRAGCEACDAPMDWSAGHAADDVVLTKRERERGDLRYVVKGDKEGIL